MFNSSLSCVGPFSSIFCSSSLNFASLEQLSFDSYGLGLIQSQEFVSPSFVKYRMYPFRRVSSNDTINKITYDYLVPIYGSNIDLSFVDNVSYEKKNIKFEQFPCLNQLIGLLNESKFFSKMQMISNRIDEEVKQMWDDDDMDEDDDDFKAKLKLKSKNRSKSKLF